MSRLGFIDVTLVRAKGLDNNDFLPNADPYVIFTYRSQEHRSTMVKDSRSNPRWDIETFQFVVFDDVFELNVKLMAKESFTEDDFLGEAKIPFHSIFYEEYIPATYYSVFNNNQEYCGMIQVALVFSREVYGRAGA